MFEILKNLISSWKLVWKPYDFTHLNNTHLKDLKTKIKNFQKDYEIEETGVVDTTTFRRLETEKEAREDLVDNYIICNGNKIAIDWDKVVPLTDPNSFALKAGFKKARRIRNPTRS